MTGEPDGRTRLEATISRGRRAFDAARAATQQQIASEGLQSLGEWALPYLAGIEDRQARHSALDGILAVLDDLEAS